jgi:hypothetical protein
VLEVDAGATPAPVLAPWPRTRTRTFALQAQRTNLIEFLRLHGCGLGALIGERSSALGRVMVPSQRLAYEHRFLIVADRCLASGELSDDEQASLKDIVDLKRAQLDRVAWNATLGSEALAGAFTLDTTSLAPGAVSGAGRAATGALRQWLRRLPQLGSDALSLEDWEAPWETLAASDFPGRARRSVARLTQAFDDVAAIIERRERARPLCPQGLPTDRAQILRNLFTRYYAGGVQPYLAELDAELRPWFEALEALRGPEERPAPPGFDAAVAPMLGAATPDSEWSRLLAARDRHTRAWQDLLSRCGLSPQRP